VIDSSLAVTEIQANRKYTTSVNDNKIVTKRPLGHRTFFTDTMSELHTQTQILEVFIGETDTIPLL